MRNTRFALYLSVLVAGCATLGVEISAAHLLRAVYGTSNIVWSSVIGLMLLYLTAGYRLGGRWADRPPGAQPATFYRLLAWAGFAAGAAIVLTRLLLRPAATALASINVGPVVGSFLASMALLAVPVVLLGCVAPYAVRLALGPAAEAENSGQAAGGVYAATTLGSMVGTFLPPLLLIPLVGARLTFWLLAGLLVVLAAAGLLATRLSRLGGASRSWLLASAFGVGLVSLGVELTANRLLGPAFGDSNLVWAAIIGVNLAALALGYLVGGRLADRTPDPVAYYLVLLLGGLTAALPPLLARPALDVASELFAGTPAGFTLAVASSAAVLMGLPVTLMGCATPFAIRLLLRQAPSAGGTAGTLYAISTAGSLLGASLPVLWLIPALGAAGALLILAIALSGLASVWLLVSGEGRNWVPVVLPLALLAAVPLTQGRLKDTPGQLYETESAYNYIEVVEQDGVRYLLLNEGQGIHSVYDPSGGLTGGTWDYFLAAPFFNRPPYRPDDVDSLALIGLAAGTISQQYTAAFGPLPVDGIEIDPTIVAVGRDYFAMTGPNLNVIVGDGRYELARLAGRRYDVVGIDAYRLPYIPWHLTTREFFEQVRDHLTPEGVVAINVGRTPTDRSLIEAMSATLAAVFSSVHTLDVPATFNTILVATSQPTEGANLADNLALMDLDTPALLRNALANAQAALRPTVLSETVFTDDDAPVEMITNRIVIEFALSGDIGALGSPLGR